jgi:hypothetical protein
MTTLVLCPSRGRPEKAAELLGTFVRTAELPTTKLAFILDEDDATAQLYPEGSYVVPRGRPGMADALNLIAAREACLWDVIGFVGDDHRFRTPGWDRRVTQALRHGGFAYGDDLYQRENLPTAVFISGPIVEKLGWFCPPAQMHLYLDNAWKYLGERSGSLHYLSDVIIEHMHPAAGKATWDEGYARVNAVQMYDKDRIAYESWLLHAAGADVSKVREAIAEMAEA